jgi:hypothetical protein
LNKVTASLGVNLPDTLMTATPNGWHRFYRWPSDLPRPKGPMFGGVVTRWPFGDEGQGYLVGPGSVVVQESGALGMYRAYGLDDEDGIADLPRVWAEAALAWKPPREVKVTAGPLVEVTGGPKYDLPVSVSEGMRYAAILAYTAHLYNRGLSSNEMWPLVQAELAPRFDVKLSRPELRERFERAVRDIAARLGEPKSLASVPDFSAQKSTPALVVNSAGVESEPPSQVPGESNLPAPLRAVPAVEFAALLAARDPIDYLIPGWVPGHALTVVAGHPKSMKSLAVLQMLGAFVAGGEWLGADASTEATHVGLYLTREGSYSEMLDRTNALIARHGPALGNRLRFIYEEPIEFNASSYSRVSEMLAALESEMSVLGPVLRVMLVLDPLRDLMPLDGDENEAKTMAVVKRWCRSLISDFSFLSIVLVHHLRKSAAGSTGLEMSGSGAMYGAVDSTVIWKAKKENEPEDSEALVFVGEMYGSYRVETRGDAPFTGRWRWDVSDGLIVPGVGRQETASGRAVAGTAVAGVLDALRSCGTLGATPKTIGDMTGVSDTNARVQLNRLSEKGVVVKESGLWYADGFAPFQQPDVILPVGAGDDDDGEVWVDPLHRS